MRFSLLPASLLAAAALALPLSAQCGSMTVSGSGAAGDTLTFEVSGVAADAFVVLLAGKEAGDFSFSFGPLGTLNLGLVPPFIPFGVVKSDADGNATIEKTIPGRIPFNVDLHGQAASVEFGFNMGQIPPIGFNFCETNVVDFTVGG
ncbi:MAG: hypothetical protein ACYTG5_00845 [Planctomycetota bacterium]|jgi:hypothetical protein